MNIPPRQQFDRQFDMTPDGRFITPPATPVSSRLFRYALIAAVVAGAGAIAALALWVAFLLIPIAFAAAVIAWGVYRWQVWRARGGFNGPRDIYRP